jgi:tetratricopeptide (TPR) repeat protein
MADTVLHEGASPPIPVPVDLPGYAIESLIGRGGMGVVYKAWQLGLNRPAAVKMIRGTGPTDPREITRFLVEAEAIAAVKHPHVVQVYECAQHDGQPYLALEYCAGGSLADMLKTSSRFAPRRAAELIEKVARGVEAAHVVGIIHRDLKPSNILLDAAGEPKVADFGLAKRGGGHDLTRTFAVIGTPAYMAPEQAQGGSKFVGPAADVWALGVILYECLTGTKPFDGEDPWNVLQRVMVGDPPSVRSRSREVPRDLELICLKCLRKEPAERYATAAALADDLRNYLDGRPVTARPTSGLLAAWKWAKRYPGYAALWAGLTVALLAGAATSTTFALAARAEAVRARQQEEETKAALARVTEEQENARTAYRQTRQAVDECFTLTFDHPLLQQVQMQPVRELLASTTDKYYRDFVTRARPAELDLPLSDPAARDTLYDYALAVENQARLNVFEAGHWSADAATRLNEALAIQMRLAAADPSDSRFARRVAALHGYLGMAHWQAGQMDEAVRRLTETRNRFASLLATHPDDPELRRATIRIAWELAGALARMNRAAEAEALLDGRRALLEVWAAQTSVDATLEKELGKTWNILGNMAAGRGDLSDATKRFRIAERILASAAAADPNLADARFFRAEAAQNLGFALTLQQKWADARDAYQRALPDLRGFIAAYPHLTDYAGALAQAAGGLAEACFQIGDLPAAEQAILESAENYTRFQDKQGLANCAGLLARMSTTATDPNDAERLASAAAVWLGKLAELGLKPDDKIALRADPVFRRLFGRADIRKILGGPEFAPPPRPAQP